MMRLELRRPGGCGGDSCGTLATSIFREPQTELKEINTKFARKAENLGKRKQKQSLVLSNLVLANRNAAYVTGRRKKQPSHSNTCNNSLLNLTDNLSKLT